MFSYEDRLRALPLYIKLRIVWQTADFFVSNFITCF